MPLLRSSFNRTVAAPPAAAPNATPFKNARTGLRYATLQAALDDGGGSAPVSGDTIKVAPGTYIVNSSADVGSLTYILSSVPYGVLLDTLTIEWETFGTRPVIDMSGYSASSQASGGDGHCLIMGTTCHTLTVRGLDIKGYRGAQLCSGVYILTGYPAAPAAGPSATLTVEYCAIRQCVNGILTRPNYSFTGNYRYTTFEDNGKGDGLSHGIYASDNAAANFLGCTFRTTAASAAQPGLGHLIKSRATVSTVQGCLFDPAHGTATCMDFPNGGTVSVAGNVILRYGAAAYNDDNPPIKFGEEQVPSVNANSPSFAGGGQTDNFVHDSRTHSLTLAQNTIRMVQPEGGTPIFPVLQLTTPTTDWYLAGVPTPQSSGGTGGDVAMTVTQTVRNNIVGSDTAAAANFVSTYPSNTAVSNTTISNLGVYSGDIVSGDPVVNDAAYAYASEFAIPNARTDTNRGGVIVGVPSWVPSTALVWTAIPSTTFDNYMKDDGSGIASAAGAEPTGGTNAPTYALYRKWTSFGGPAYSRKRHEIYAFGGGHAATTLNFLARWNLNLNTPSMTLMCAQTASATKQANWNTSYVNTTSRGYWPDGKPMNPHGYNGLQYFDAIDELVQVGLSYVVSPFTDLTVWQVVAGFPRSGTAWRADAYWADMPTPNSNDDASMVECPVFKDWAGAIVYYYKDRGSSIAYRKLTASTRAHTTISGGDNYGSLDFRRSRGSMRHDNGKALLIGNNTSSGWNALMFDSASGSLTSQSMAGASFPSEHFADLAWSSSGGFWLAWFAEPADDNNPISSQKVYKITITGTNALTATLLSPSGTALAGTGGNFHGMYYDDWFDCFIFVGAYNENLKALKVT